MIGRRLLVAFALAAAGLAAGLLALDRLFPPDLARYPFTTPPGWGYSLSVVYLVWAVVVITMYPLCRWFAALKQRRSDAWLSYL